MEQPRDPLRFHPTVMPSGSPQKPSIPGNYCPTPPGASPSKDDFAGNGMSQLGSPAIPPPKHVSFELLLDDNSKVRARIPMRVQIFPHDTTDSIVTTVKNFYGIYEATASGVSFEDANGVTLIARYENLRNNMTVYVRVIPTQDYPDHYAAQPPHYGPHQEEDAFNRPGLGEPFQMPHSQVPQASGYGEFPPRPASRAAGKRSVSPSARGRRSASIQKGWSRIGNKSRGSSTHGSFHEDALGHCSDSDGTHGSISGSKKAKSEQFVNSDISMENILLDGRRKRPNFDSSELPLFVPPQVPRTTSTSSISPQRRSIVQEGASPFSGQAQRPFAPNQPLPSPQSFGHHEQLYALQSVPNPQYVTPTPQQQEQQHNQQHGHRLRDRTKIQPASYYPGSGNRSGGGSGILPTPDPTIASCISDEDVAMQLIRLGDASNFSHGRNSTSTVDDAFSGIVDASSSAGATSDGAESADDERELPRRREGQNPGSSPLLPPGPQHKNLDDILPSFGTSGPSSDDTQFQPDSSYSTAVKSEYGGAYEEHAAKRVKHNHTKDGSVKQSSSSKANRSSKSRPPTSSSRKTKAPSTTTNKSMGPPPPANSMKQPPRPNANVQTNLGAGDEDLSSKPRCQRCRKSKKGCDRQRPCQRCKDAGIGVEGCVSEDEGNGRKGRFGRHMGVSVKRVLGDSPAPAEHHVASAPGSMLPPADKNKKRKR